MRKIYYDDQAAIKSLLNKSHSLCEDDKYNQVNTMIQNIKKDGYEAVNNYTKTYDGPDLNESQFRVSEKEIEEAFNKVDDEFLKALDLAINNVEDFHRKQLIGSTLDTKEEGIVVGQLIRPLKRVGLYVPGGTAAYPSSVLMTALPGKVAGVEELVMISPPGADGSMNPYTLVAAKLCGVSEIYKVGGAQGVAALAYGAGPLKKVDKIAGPGNIYVTIAKKIVYGDVDIDMLAGPSEILVIGDEGAKPQYLAADLLSQGEHDTLASAIFVTTSETLADAVTVEVEKQLRALSREAIARKSIETNGAIIITKTLDEAIAFANAYGPEHLELAIEKPYEVMGSITSAGAIFLGYYTPEPIGDYFAGPNHVLPTGGTGRFYSPLNTHMYLKKTSIINYSQEALNKYGKYAAKLAAVEGFDGHENAILVRLNDGK